ncbi:MAG: hypothetical protein ABI721_01785 [Candidatus Dojkabacteria bacterium]
MNHTDEKLLLEIILEHTRNKRVLDLTGGMYTLDLIENGASEVMVNENRKSEVTKLKKMSESEVKISLMDLEFTEFIELCEEIHEKFDLIVFHDDRFLNTDFDLQKEHKEIIRQLQNELLNDAGILFFIVRQSTFILDDYLKPGADKLTKKLNVDPEKRAFQCWAFYN